MPLLSLTTTLLPDFHQRFQLKKTEIRRHQPITIYNSFLFTLIYCVYVGILWYTACIEVIRHTVEVFPSTTWASKIKLGSSSLAASTFAH